MGGGSREDDVKDEGRAVDRMEGRKDGCNLVRTYSRHDCVIC